VCQRYYEYERKPISLIFSPFSSSFKKMNKKTKIKKKNKKKVRESIDNARRM
jgi:hypothetical protein